MYNCCQTHIEKEAHVLRYRTTEAFLASGTPLERLPFFRDLIENGVGSLTSSSHLRSTYIPKIEAEQLSLLKDEFRQQACSLQFDGTTRIGEAIVCVGRFCSADFETKTRLLMLKTTATNVKGRQLSALITQLVCSTLGIDPTSVVAVTRDSASVNGDACKRMESNPFVCMQQFMCICHTINNAGARVSLSLVDQFMTPWLDLVGGRSPHRGAQSLWKEMVAPTRVPGFSNVRWYAKAEIMFVLATHFDKLSDFLDELDEYDYGDATRRKMRDIFENQRSDLQLQLTGMLDLRPLVKTTYELEGDRLEILLVYRRVQGLRELGESIKHYDDGCLPNVQALLRDRMPLVPGVELEKDFPPHGTFSASIISSSRVQSTLYPGKEVVAYKVRYPSDGKREDLEEEELRPLLITTHLPEFRQVCDSLLPAFSYLEDRLLGRCNDIFNCEDMYEACRLLQIFDPSFAAAHASPQFIDKLFTMPAFGDGNAKRNMKSELPKYKSLCAQWDTIDHGCVDKFTAQVLKFWRNTRKEIPSWARAAQIAFAMSPNSASCERVFSLLESMFGEEQHRALADLLQASLFLRYNKRILDAGL